MKIAASNGVPEANEHLGWLYFRNQYVPKDLKKSFAYMKKAADLGDDIAQAHIAQAYENGIWGAPEIDLDLSKKYYDMALAQDNDHAQWAVGENYLGGYNGYPLDEYKAVEYFKKGAKNGSHRAQLSLALCYYNGKGVQKNMSECAKWLEVASEQGNAEAQWRLGLFMLEGNGITKDIAKGKQWIQKSAEQGDESAIELLEELMFDEDNEILEPNEVIDNNKSLRIKDKYENNKQETFESKKVVLLHHVVLVSELTILFLCNVFDNIFIRIGEYIAAKPLSACIDIILVVVMVFGAYLLGVFSYAFFSSIMEIMFKRKIRREKVAYLVIAPTVQMLCVWLSMSLLSLTTWE